MSSKTRRALLIVALALLPAGAGLAHTGVKPKHGGIVREANHLAYELVAAAEGVTIYVYDHDRPLATKGMSGRLVVLHGTAKSEAELKPAGDNRLVAPGVKLGKGAKAVATLKGADNKVATLRFALD